MGDKTAIEWTDATWNPIRAKNRKTGRIGWHCTHVSEGCRRCYAETMNVWRGTGLAYKPGHEAALSIFLDPVMVEKPLHWKKPRKIFVCSMTDLFADFVKDAWIRQMFDVMVRCPQHTFQILTKRPASMFDIMHAMWDVPPPNVWLGVSVEDQTAADERIPLLLQTPAAKRFLSVEPLLGPVDLASDFGGTLWIGGQRGHDGRHHGNGSPDCPRDLHHHHDNRCERGIDWVIAGGESGPGARPMHPSWPRSLRDQCAAAGVPFLFKQWGEWVPHEPVAGGDLGGDVRAGRVMSVHPTGQSDLEVFRATGGRNSIAGTRYAARVGKKIAGRLLDGVKHNGYPS